MYEKNSLEDTIMQKGVVSEEGLCHELRDLRHDYKGGCILKVMELAK